MTVVSAPPECTLDWEWLAAPSRRAPELDATWARLRIGVGAEPVTLAHDPASGVLHDHITVPLYPLAEWVAFNWWSLTEDARPGTQMSQLRGSYRNGVGDQRGAWWIRCRRHTLRAAGDGYWWPDLLFVTEGAQTRIVWMPDGTNRPRGDARLIGRGNATVPSAALHRTLADFVDAVVARLADAGVDATPLAQEWAAIRGADHAEVLLCRRLAQLGLDPYRDAGEHAATVTAVANTLPAHLADDFFNSAEADRIRDQAAWLARARTIAEEGPTEGTHPDHTALLGELRAACADLTERFYASDGLDSPWQLGFLTARRVRDHLGVPDLAEFDPGKYLTYHTEQVPYLDRGLVAFGSRTGRDGPTLVSTRRFTHRPRRFLLARALWHVLADPNDTFVIVASHTHRQHIARGFALELLAPAAGIAELLTDPEHLVSSEDVEVVSDHYGVGTIVVEHQLDNKVLAMDFRWQPPADGFVPFT